MLVKAQCNLSIFTRSDIVFISNDQHHLISKHQSKSRAFFEGNFVSGQIVLDPDLFI